MSLLNPAALALGLLGIPILLLYILKLRRQEVRVSSTLLWHLLRRDRQANRPWQRLQRNLLLILQLIILGALVSALARPALKAPAVAADTLVILLDGSASMNAIDAPPNRFASAREQVRALIDNAPERAQVTLILVGPRPQVLVSAETDKAALRQTLQAAEPAQGVADWEAAFALAAGALGSAARAATTLIASDGGVPDGGLPALPGTVLYLPIGSSADNLAISALSLRPQANGAQLFARLNNFGDVGRAALFSVHRDGALLHAQYVHLPAGAAVPLVLSDLPGGPAAYRAALTAPEGAAGGLDALPLDDVAYAVSQPETSRRVLLITEGNFFLEQVLAALPDVQPYRSLPDETGQPAPPGEAFDLYVLDGFAPDPLPPGDLLLINPPPNPLLEVSGLFTDTSPARVADHPLAEFVNWDAVHVARAQRIVPPVWGAVLVRAPGGPLVLAGEVEGRRVAVITFDLHNSDLPLQIAFPILFNNLLGYLIPEGPFDAPVGLRPGEPLNIRPRPGMVAVSVVSPSGQVYPLELDERGAVFTQTDEPGVYIVVSRLASGEQVSSRLAVNLFSELEANIRPRNSISLGRQEVLPVGESQSGRREIWPWFAALGLAVLSVEWWVYHGRPLPGGRWLRAKTGPR